MNKGFSLIECVVYILCLTIILGLLSEMVFRFYCRINDDLKSIQHITNSLVCLNTILMDLYKAMSGQAIKNSDINGIVVRFDDEEVRWTLKENSIYRICKKLEKANKRSNKSASLMMQNISFFDVTKCFRGNTEQKKDLSGFKVRLKSNGALGDFEHYIASRKFAV